MFFPPTAPVEYRIPAEWEPQRAVWVSWATYDNRRGESVTGMQSQLVRALAKTVDVVVTVRDSAHEADARADLKGVPRVRFLRTGNNEIWIRDFGPIFLKGPGEAQAVADFRFNYWGYLDSTDPVARAEEAVDRRVAEKLQLPLRRSKLISEGGNREFNGLGTMMAVETVELRRNPGLTRDDIEAEFRRVFRVKKVIWLKRGSAEDDMTTDGPLPGNVYTVITTGGHIDNVTRFVGPRRVAIAEVTAAEAARSPILAESRRRYLENLAILQGSTDQDGKSLQIVKLPSPELVITQLRPGDDAFTFIRDMKFASGRTLAPNRPIRIVPAASYANFLVSNGVVITSRLWRPGLPLSIRKKDARAVAVLRDLFPGRRIVAIDTWPINLGGGGIHCITQPQWR